MPHSALIILTQRWIEPTQKTLSQVMKAFSDLEMKD